MNKDELKLTIFDLIHHDPHFAKELITFICRHKVFKEEFNDLMLSDNNTFEGIENPEL